MPKASFSKSEIEALAKRNGAPPDAQGMRRKAACSRLLGARRALCLALLALAASSPAQITQQKIENPDEGEIVHALGVSVAVDGDTMVAGESDSAHVYVRDGLGDWQLEAVLTADDVSPTGEFGEGIAISGDTAVVGAYWDDDHGSKSGSAYVFTRTAGVWTQQQKLTAADGAADDEFGWAVSVSGDTIVVGARGDDDSGSYAGSAYVFTRTGGVWSQQQKLTPADATAGKAFGCSVSMSGDTVVVGAFGDGEPYSYIGAAYIFTRAGGVWTQQDKLTANDAARDDHFGISVAASGDTVVVGVSWKYTPGSGMFGAAYVFTRTGGVWSQQQKLIADDGPTQDQFGSSVSVAGDTAVIGAFYRAGGRYYSGSAFVFTRAGGVWTKRQKLASAPSAAGDWFGFCVSVSGDTAVVGAFRDSDAGELSGAVYVYQRAGVTWPQQAKLVPTFAENDFFGNAVSLAGDTAIVGADSDNDKGSAHVFMYANGAWTQQQYLTADDVAMNGYFGRSVAVAGDTAIVGAPGDDDAGSGSGSAYIFARAGGVWTQQQKLIADDAAASDYFGSSVSVSNDTILVGAKKGDGATTDTGSAYVFTNVGGAWVQQQELIPADAVAGDYFGYSVSISGDTAVVGAYHADGGTTDSGAAYVFTRTAGSWTQQQKLTADDGAAEDYFGFSISVSGDTVVVGAYGDDDGTTTSGSAYIFTCTAGVWTQQAKLTAADAAEDDWFGHSVSLSGDVAVVGAHLDDDGGSHSGSAYLFARAGGVWTQQAKLTAADGTAYDALGISVAIDAGRIICGAPNKDDPETYSGAAYVFEYEYTAPVETGAKNWILY